MVNVTEVGAEEAILIPVDWDGFLSRSLLKEYFPGAVGLMYLEEDGKKKIPVS